MSNETTQQIKDRLLDNMQELADFVIVDRSEKDICKDVINRLETDADTE